MNVRVIKYPKKSFELLSCNPIQNDGRIRRCSFLGLAGRYRVESLLEHRRIAGEKITVDTEKGVLCLSKIVRKKHDQLKSTHYDMKVTSLEVISGMWRGYHNGNFSIIIIRHSWDTMEEGKGGK